MIENLTFSETVESYTSEHDSNILLAKSIGKYVADKLATEYIEYSDGVVIRRLDLPDICVKSDKNGVHRISIAVVRQSSDELTEDTSSVMISVDFVIDSNVQAFSSNYNMNNSIKTSTDWTTLNIMTNNESFFIVEKNSHNVLFGLVQDEDDDFYVWCYSIYDKNYNSCSFSSIFNSSYCLDRTNINEIFLINNYLSFGSKITKRLKYLYCVMQNNIIAKSRYKINGEEYYALTDTCLFRTEGGD